VKKKKTHAVRVTAQRVVFVVVVVVAMVRRGARRVTAAVVMIVVVVVAVTPSEATTCAYAARRETCAARTGFDAASANASASACGGALNGAVVCETHGHGIAFDGASTRLAASASASAWVRAVRESEAFTIEIAASLRSTPSGGAGASGRQPLITLSTTDIASEEENACLEEIGGYDLAVWLQNRRVFVEIREPWLYDGSLSCSSTSVFDWTGVQTLNIGDIHRIAVVYDVNGIRVWVNDTLSFPPPLRLDFKLSPGGAAASMWDATSSSRFVLGAYGGAYFRGTMYDVRLRDRALNASEIAELANAPLANASPHPTSQNITMAEDSIATISLDAVDADGDDIFFDIVRLPNRGALFADSACVEPITVTPHRLRAPEVWYAPDRNEYSPPDVDYASFEFIATDDADMVNINDRALVRVRVTSVNDAPEPSQASVDSMVSILGYAPTRARFAARDVDRTCPPDYPDCVRDSFTSVVITRAPALGTLYASCDDDVALDGAAVARDGWTRSSAPGTDDDGLLCFTYVYSGDAVMGDTRDAVEYVIHDAHGATSATLKMEFSIQSPCVALSREHVVDEDAKGDVTFTAACVDSTVANGTVAHISMLPRYGTVSTEMMELRESSCSIEQRASCETWANAYGGGQYDDVRCVCGAIEYSPARDYFNTPSVDVYGATIAFDDAYAPPWPVGSADAMRVTLATTNGWRTIPYVTYVWVRARVDAPTIRIDRHGLRNIEPIVPDSTSYVLSNAIDIDAHPDYDVDAMAVTVWSPNARLLELIATADVLENAGVSSGVSTSHLLPDVDTRPNAVRFIGAASAIRQTLRFGAIAYAPFDATVPAFYDVIHVRVVVGLRPLTTPQCVSPWQTPPCRFTSIIDVPRCDAVAVDGATSPCAVDTEFLLPIADAPTYIAQASDQDNPKNRTRAERAAIVFAIVFAFAFVATALALKLLKCLRAGLLGSF